MNFAHIEPFWVLFRTVSNRIELNQTQLRKKESSTAARCVRANPTRVHWPNWHTHATQMDSGQSGNDKVCYLGLGI